MEVCINLVNGLLVFLPVNRTSLFEYMELYVSGVIRIKDVIRWVITKNRLGTTYMGAVTPGKLLMLIMTVLMMYYC